MLPIHIAVSLGIGLRAVANTDDLPAGEPIVDLINATALVGFSALGQASEEPGEIHPGCFAEDEGPFGVELVEKGTEEVVEVIGRGGKVEPGWRQGLLDVGVQLGHAGDRCRLGYEGAAKNADRGWCHGDFDGVVNVYANEMSAVISSSITTTACSPEMTAHPSGSAKWVNI